MKRFRHYKKDKAIVLACFGSIIEQQKYLKLKEEVAQKFEGVDVYLSFNSRMVIKKLKKEGQEFKNLPQVLADVDMEGYKKVAVISVNLFPTDEHDEIKKVVEGFNSFSLANFRCSNAILTKTKESTNALSALDKAVSKEDIANLYIIHGTPRLDLKGIASIEYAEGFLTKTNTQNFACSLEGAYPFFAMKETISKQIQKAGFKKVQIIPLLLVSGNHYDKDMFEITEELSEDFESFIAPSVSQSEKFNLIEFEAIRKIIFQNIKEELTKLA